MCERPEISNSFCFMPPEVLSCGLGSPSKDAHGGEFAWDLSRSSVGFKMWPS